MSKQAFERWLPVSFKFSAKTASVRWLDFGVESLSEPFFNHTLKRLKGTTPAASERSTAITPLLEASEAAPDVKPAGIIFHVSRCGSTLLVNALKTGEECAVMAEAHPIGLLFKSNLFQDSVFPDESREDVRKLLLDSVVKLYAAAFGSSLVIKCHAASILQISRFRGIWPTVPFLIVIRDPVEVIVSNLARPSGWLKSMHRPSGRGNVFGLTDAERLQMTIEQYCAMGLARFLEAAVKQLDGNCWVLDYDELDIRSIYRVSRLFKIRLPHSDAPQIQRAVRSYSKDRSGGSRLFESDREAKQREATDSVRRLAREWAQKPYETLRKGGLFPGNIL